MRDEELAREREARKDQISKARGRGALGAGAARGGRALAAEKERLLEEQLKEEARATEAATLEAQRLADEARLAAEKLERERLRAEELEKARQDLEADKLGLTAQRESLKDEILAMDAEFEDQTRALQDESRAGTSQAPGRAAPEVQGKRERERAPGGPGRGVAGWGTGR